MIVFLVVFIACQIYQIAIAFSSGLIVRTLFGAFIVWLTVIEYRKRRRSRVEAQRPHESFLTKIPQMGFSQFLASIYAGYITCHYGGSDVGCTTALGADTSWRGGLRVAASPFFSPVATVASRLGSESAGFPRSVAENARLLSRAYTRLVG